MRKYGWPLFAAAFLFLLALPASAEFRAGAARRPVTPDLTKHAPVYMAGFGQNRVATRIHDDLWARCLALAVDRTPLVLCGVDSIGLFLEDVERIRAEARTRLGGAVDVIVAATHDHEAPDTMGLWGPEMGVSGINEEYNRFVVEQTAAAAVEAVRSLRPARVKTSKVSTRELDGFLNDTRPPVVHDSELVVLSATGRDGRAIGALVNWANHPETLGSKNTLVTADYPAYFYLRMEELTGGVAVLINGAIGGMQSSLGAKVTDPETGQPAPADSFRMAEIIGRRVAELAAGALSGEKPRDVNRLEFREKKISIPVTNAGYRMAAQAGLFKGRKPMEGDGAVTVVGYARLGSDRRRLLEIAMVPGELYPELSVGGVARFAGADFPDAPIEPALKKVMKAPYRMLFGLANDEIGYIIPRAEWDEEAPWLQNAPKRWYGEVNSTGPETAPRISDTFRQLIESKRVR
jgi:hypothetical protein